VPSHTNPLATIRASQTTGPSRWRYSFHESQWKETTGLVARPQIVVVNSGFGQRAARSLKQWWRVVTDALATRCGSGGSQLADRLGAANALDTALRALPFIAARGSWC
jgi:hypothetical protein